MTSHPVGGAWERGARGEPRDTPAPGAPTAAVHLRERGGVRADGLRRTAAPPPPARSPACTGCHEPQGTACLSLLQPHTSGFPPPRATASPLQHEPREKGLPSDPSARPPPCLGDPRPRAARSVGSRGSDTWRVGGVGSETEPLQELSSGLKSLFRGSWGRGLGRSPTRIPSEWTGGVATGLACRRTWVWPRSRLTLWKCT